jgi:hypothetical protein
MNGHPAALAERSDADAGRSDGRRTAALSLAAAFGLLLALAASFDPSVAPADGIARQLIIAWPEWLTIAVLVMLSAASLLFLWLLIPQRRRRRRKDEEEFEFVHEPPKMTFGDYVGTFAIALVPLIFLAVVLWSAADMLSLSPGPQRDIPNAETRASTPVTPAQPAPVIVSSPRSSAALGTLAIVVAAGALGFMLWIYFGDWWLRTAAAPRPAAAALQIAVAESIDAVRAEPDFRRAIVKCYRHFELALAAAAVPRAPWQTPLEFMQAVFHTLRIPGEPVEELTRLFEVARFSRRPMDAQDRDSALAALEAIRSSLRERDEGDDG